MYMMTNTRSRFDHMIIPPARLTVEESYDKAMDRLRSGDVHKAPIIHFTRGVLWGIRRPDLVRRINFIDTVADLLEELHGDPQALAADDELRYAFTVICDMVSWELNPDDPREEYRWNSMKGREHFSIGSSGST